MSIQQKIREILKLRIGSPQGVQIATDEEIKEFWSEEAKKVEEKMRNNFSAFINLDSLFSETQQTSFFATWGSLIVSAVTLVVVLFKK